MRIILVILSITIFLLKVNPALAITVTISNIPTTITDQPFEFNVSVSTSGSSGTSYLKANLFPTDTFNYFGYTYNGSSFVNSSTYTDYLPITLDSSGNWTGIIKAKLDSTSNFFTGSGNYSLKVRRYTSASSYTWSNEIVLTVNYSSPITSSSPSPSSSPISSFTITSVPTQINSDESITLTIDLALPNSPNAKFYLKGAFKKPDTSNYFGLTKIGNAWIGNSSSYSDQFYITTDSSGNWLGNLEVKPDPFDSGYDGSGTYLFKIGRYSDSGSGPTWSNEVSLNINAKPIVATDNNLDFSKITTASISSSNSKSKISEEDLPEEAYSLEKYRHSASIAGTATATPLIKVDVQKQNNSSPLIFLGGGLIFGAFSYIIYTFIKHKKYDL